MTGASDVGWWGLAASLVTLALVVGAPSALTREFDRFVNTDKVVESEGDLRARLTDPEVLLLDEPTSALDPGATRLLERLARELAGQGVAMLWVTHDLGQARRLADSTIVLVDGRVADEAEPRSYLSSPAEDRFRGDEDADGTATDRPSGKGRPGAA